MLNDTYAVTNLNVLNVDTYKIRVSSGGRNSRSQVQTSMVLFCFLSSSFFFFFFYSHSKYYCNVDYKVFIIRNNKLMYLSRMKSCLRGWSCYHYSLAQRSISHRIHIFLATLSIICKCGLLGIRCVSIWCASGREFLFRASATYRSL